VPDGGTALAAACTSLYSAWVLLPDDVDNGGMYELLVHLNLVAGLLWSLVTGRPICEGWVASAPAARCLQVLVFSFAALARINSDYHDVRHSSSSVLTLQLLDELGAALGLPSLAPLGDRMLTFLLRCVLLALEVIGLAVPLLLWCGRARLGLGLAWALALALGCAPASFDSACLLVASMPFWVPPHRLLALRWMTTLPAARGCGLLAALALLSPTLLQQSSRERRRVHMAAMLWMLAANPLQYTAAAPAAPPPTCEMNPSLPSLLQQVGTATLLLAALNGAAPYLGLKTQSTWALWSNLRVEGGTTNHLFIPASLQLFGYTGECVTVTKTNVPALQDHHTVIGDPLKLKFLGGFVERTGAQAVVHDAAGLCDEREVLPYEVPFFQLRRIIALHTIPLLQEFYVEYLHFGAPHRFEVRGSVPLRGSDLRLASAPPAFLAKLLAFRSVPVGGFGAACGQ